MVARQHNGIFDIFKNLQGPKVYLCARFGCLPLDGLGRVHRQINKRTDRDLVYYGQNIVLVSVSLTCFRADIILSEDNQPMLL